MIGLFFITFGIFVASLLTFLLPKRVRKFVVISIKQQILR